MFEVFSKNRAISQKIRAKLLRIFVAYRTRKIGISPNFFCAPVSIVLTSCPKTRNFRISEFLPGIILARIFHPLCTNMNMALLAYEPGAFFCRYFHSKPAHLFFCSAESPAIISFPQFRHIFSPPYNFIDRHLRIILVSCRVVPQSGTSSTGSETTACLQPPPPRSRVLRLIFFPSSSRSS